MIGSTNHNKTKLPVTTVASNPTHQVSPTTRSTSHTAVHTAMATMASPMSACRLAIREQSCFLVPPEHPAVVGDGADKQRRRQRRTQQADAVEVALTLVETDEPHGERECE